MYIFLQINEPPIIFISTDHVIYVKATTLKSLAEDRIMSNFTGLRLHSWWVMFSLSTLGADDLLLLDWTHSLALIASLLSNNHQLEKKILIGMHSVEPAQTHSLYFAL